MVNLHDLYLSTLEVILDANKLDAVNQPEGSKPSGVIYAMHGTMVGSPKGKGRASFAAVLERQGFAHIESTYAKFL